MSYQVQDLKTAQALVDKLTRALRFWIPDELTENDTDFERWYEDRQLADGYFRTTARENDAHG